jgi:hypothetical protein
MRTAMVPLLNALILIALPGPIAAAQCTFPLDLGPGEDVAIPTVGAIFAIVGPPSGFVVGARAEVAVDAPAGESADNWAIALAGFDLITDSGGAGGWAFSGSDFGWSGPGQFSGTLTTNSLNGAIRANGPFSYWEAQVQPVDAFFTGQMLLNIHIILDAADTFPADLDGDQFVGLNDLTLMLSSFGIDTGGDVDCDGDTDLDDLTFLLSRFGTCAPLIC